MEKVRFGIIGIGNIGTVHARYLLAGTVSDACPAAVCDNAPEKHPAIRQLVGSLPFQRCAGDASERAYRRGDCRNAALRASASVDAGNAPRHPHALRKPAGVYTAQVQEMNACARTCDVVFGIMYNQRPNPLYQKVKDLIDSGELGEIRRSNWIITNWYRSQSYYNSGGWRATERRRRWRTAQSGPTSARSWQWLVGMPIRLRAFCQFGKHRDIEVEDEVTAYAEYANGATGVFITTVAETPGTNRLEIVGDRGKVIVEEGKLRYWRLRESETAFNARWQNGFGEPECWEVTLPVGPECSEHHVITANFCGAILRGEPLIAPGWKGSTG